MYTLRNVFRLLLYMCAMFIPNISLSQTDDEISPEQIRGIVIRAGYNCEKVKSLHPTEAYTDPEAQSFMLLCPDYQYILVYLVTIMPDGLVFVEPKTERSHKGGAAGTVGTAVPWTK